MNSITFVLNPSPVWKVLFFVLSSSNINEAYLLGPFMPLKVNNHNGKLLRKHKISNTTLNMNELQWVLWHYKEIKLVKKDYLNLGHKNRSFKSRLRI